MLGALWPHVINLSSTCKTARTGVLKIVCASLVEALGADTMEVYDDHPCKIFQALQQQLICCCGGSGIPGGGANYLDMLSEGCVSVCFSSVTGNAKAGHLALLPRPRFMGHVAAFCNGLLFVTNGSGIVNDGTPADMGCYNCVTRSWTSCTPPPPPAGCSMHAVQGALANFGNSLVFSGGCQPDLFRRVPTRSAVTSCYQYDPRSDAWSKFPMLLSQRAGHGMVEYGGLLYVAGGTRGTSHVSELMNGSLPFHPTPSRPYRVPTPRLI